MELKDIKSGDYIVEELNNGSIFLNLVGHSRKPEHFINVKEQQYVPSPSAKMYKQKLLRYATPKEIIWLNTCIKAEKFIPLENINIEPIYEIY